MKFSARTFYGLKAILVLAGRFGEGSLSVTQIAKREGISVPYLEQILNALKKKGFVKSVRGPQGGYVLSKKPSDITLKSLFYLLEEKNLSRLASSAEGKPADGSLPPRDFDEVAVANQIFWDKLLGSIGEGLAGMTLKELIDQARRMKKPRPRRENYAFNI